MTGSSGTPQAAAASYFVAFAGLAQADADKLVSAILQAVEAEALDQIAATTPTTSTITDARALRLRYICAAAGRVLTRREVELIFRVPAPTADAITRRLQALYPEAIEPFLHDLVRTAVVDRIKENNEDWDIYFAEPAGFDYARQILIRHRMARDVRFNRTTQTMRVPRKIEGSKETPLDVLGLKPPQRQRVT